jgi:hypothetical protein
MSGRDPDRRALITQMSDDGGPEPVTDQAIVQAFPSPPDGQGSLFMMVIITLAVRRWPDRSVV